MKNLKEMENMKFKNASKNYLFKWLNANITEKCTCIIIITSKTLAKAKKEKKMLSWVTIIASHDSLSFSPCRLPLLYIVSGVI